MVDQARLHLEKAINPTDFASAEHQVEDNVEFWVELCKMYHHYEQPREVYNSRSSHFYVFQF
jgi:hypothetical protein